MYLCQVIGAGAADRLWSGLGVYGRGGLEGARLQRQVTAYKQRPGGES